MWSGGPRARKAQQMLHGAASPPPLERGEVEESEYVVVTVRSEPAPPATHPARDHSRGGR